MEILEPQRGGGSFLLCFALLLVCVRCVFLLTSLILSSLRFVMVWHEIFRLQQPVQIAVVTRIYEPKKTPTAATTLTETAAPSDGTCPICLLDYREGDLVTQGATCRHRFHNECLCHWLKTESSCPCCRTNIVDRRVVDTTTLLAEETVDDGYKNWFGLLDYFRLSVNMVSYS